MAQPSKPWRAMVLASVFALAACEPGVAVAPPATNSAANEANSASAEAAEPLRPDFSERDAVTAVVANGVEALVVMSGSSGDDGLLGAGCVADPDEPLPDGDWFAFVMESSSYELVVDIACVYGPDTDQFQAYANEDESVWANYVVVNDVVDERRLRLGPNAQAYMAADNWRPRAVRDVVEESQADPQAAPRGVWLRMEDGRIGAVVQPYSMGVAAD